MGARAAEDTGLGEGFEEHRARLRTVARRMLGSWPEADDAVQQTWVRFSHAGTDGVENLGAWLTTILVRVCLNLLRARAARPEDPVPGPVGCRAGQERDLPCPEQDALLAESAGQALAVVLGTLAPAERLVFVLHDIFDIPFADIAPMVGRSEIAARQLASRAHRRLGRADDRAPVAAEDAGVAAQQAVVDAFFAASRAGDFDGLVALLDPDVVLRSHGAATRPAALIEIRGAAAIARRSRRGVTPASEVLPMQVNGAAGMLIVASGHPVLVLAFTVADGRIIAIDGWSM
jgi:RNA polymerase sigma factor (sigma-70 family)